MNAIVKPIAPPALDCWITADWEEFIQIAEDPTLTKVQVRSEQ